MKRFAALVGPAPDRTWCSRGSIRGLPALLPVLFALACTGPVKPGEGTRSVTVVSIPTNGGWVIGGGTWEVPDGQEVTTTLYATPNPGYDFDAWSENGTTLSSTAVYEMEVTGEHEVRGHFPVNQNRGEWGPANTYTDYYFPGPAYESLAWTFQPAVDPPESLHEKELLHYYAYNFKLQNHVPEVGQGYAGFQSDGQIRRRRWGKVVNFSIWGSDGARTDGLVERNQECGCHQIMFQYEWIEGRAYGFELREGPGGTIGARKWWGLWVTDLVTDSVTFIGEQRLPTTIEGNPSTMWVPRTSVFGEDLHWWLSRSGAEHFVCSDFEPSSLAILNVTAGTEGQQPDGVVSRTSSGIRNVAENGHATTLCHVTVFTAENGDVQHNLGFWPEPPERVIGN